MLNFMGFNFIDVIVNGTHFESRLAVLGAAYREHKDGVTVIRYMMTNGKFITVEYREGNNLDQLPRLSPDCMYRYVTEAYLRLITDMLANKLPPSDIGDGGQWRDLTGLNAIEFTYIDGPVKEISTFTAPPAILAMLEAYAKSTA